MTEKGRDNGGLEIDIRWRHEYMHSDGIDLE
jgi:hypothetical protein